MSEKAAVAQQAVGFGLSRMRRMEAVFVLRLPLRLLIFPYSGGTCHAERDISRDIDLPLTTCLSGIGLGLLQLGLIKRAQLKWGLS